jgi:hypothetical protein
METKERIFEWNEKDNSISFNVEKDHNMMVNATEMANIFNKNAKDFLRLDNTESFISECCKDENFIKIMGFQEDNSPLEERKNKLVNVIYGGKNNGTWMHEILAIKFAAWLDSGFEVWVFLTVRDIMFETYKEDEERLKTIVGLQDKITEKEKELQNLPILKEIEALRKDEQREKRKFKQRKKIRISGFRTIFSDKEMEGKEKNNPKSLAHHK